MMKTMPEESVAQKPRGTLTGFIPPIATPFRDGALDIDSLKRMVDDLADSVSGILLGGSVGETPSLTLQERLHLMRELASYLGGSLPLAVSIADNSIENSRRLSEEAGELGASLLVASSPNYFTNNRSMLEAYFASLSDFASADLCLYDNPLATNTTLSVADIKALRQAAPRLTAVKVTDTSIDKVEALRAETDLIIYSGDDVVLWHQLTRGAEGAMVALPMIYPDLARAIWQAFSRGDLETAFEEYAPFARFVHLALGAPDYVPVIKTILHHRGVIASPEVRVPLIPLSPRRRQEVISAL
jgi:4-hydroxy-tetrahydrodipicolinate synthase